MYEYSARCVNVVDGDTFDLEVDLGFNIRHKIRVRLKDKDTPEPRSKNAAEREHAKAATSFVMDQILEPCAHTMCAGHPLTIRTEKDKIGIYGRYTATVILEDGRDLGELLADNNLLKHASYPDS